MVKILYLMSPWIYDGRIFIGKQTVKFLFKFMGKGGSGTVNLKFKAAESSMIVTGNGLGNHCGSTL